MVAIGRPIANIMQMYIKQAAFTSSLQDACVQVRRKNIWKERENIKTHNLILAVRTMLGKE
jgi:hypothetical protein